jgi:hypothetical protein
LLLQLAAPIAAATTRNVSVRREAGLVDLRDSTGFSSSKAGATDDDQQRERLLLQ